MNGCGVSCESVVSGCESTVSGCGVSCEWLWSQLGVAVESAVSQL